MSKNPTKNDHASPTLAVQNAIAKERKTSGKPSIWLPPGGLVERFRPKHARKQPKTKTDRKKMQHEQIKAP